MDILHPLLAGWFRERFHEPTDAQRLGWPEIAAGRHTLIAAPTGSGKTLAAFLIGIDRLVRDALDGGLPDETRLLYVSPLKALSNDIARNLQQPLAEIRHRAAQHGAGFPDLRALVRTGDTAPAERQAMVRRAPHILVTTPESLYLLLTAARSRDLLRSVQTVIVDEIHALARDKRGSHLSLSLARLDALCAVPPQRIGLSATQRPIDEMARFLVGTHHVDPQGQPDCAIVDVGHRRALDLAIEVPPSALSAVCSHEQWDEIYQLLAQRIAAHRSTLVFVNTRRLAERIGHRLSETLGADAVTSHHGSLSRELRLSAERRLARGELKAIVATASLELGIDVGHIDLVCQIASPRSIATFLQRVGRSGHALGRIACGRLFPLTRDDLLECMALVRAVRCGRLDSVQIPQAPLDILAQQIVAEVAARPCHEDALYALVRQAWPYRDLSRQDFEHVVDMVSRGLLAGQRRGAYLHRDRIHRTLRARRGARLAAITSGGAIPENADYRVVSGPERAFVGMVNEDFAIESMAGDIFQLGNMSWRIRYVRGGEVLVDDAHGAPATIPFWLGEAPGRTAELSEEVSALREEIAARLAGGSPPGDPAADVCDQQPNCTEPVAAGTAGAAGRALRAPCSTEPDAGISGAGACDAGMSGAGVPASPVSGSATREAAAAASDRAALDAGGMPQPFLAWLCSHCGVDPWGARQAAGYIAAQQAAVGFIPTRQRILFERFFDEAGGMQLVIHAPLGSRINRAWGLALRKRFCRSFNFELQAAADDDGIVLSLGPQHSFPLRQMFAMLRPDNALRMLEQAVLAAPLFTIRWRWNVTRALAVLRFQRGQRVPPPLQRMRADDLLSAVFPAQTACLENVVGDIEVPDHPLVRQTMHDVLHEALDATAWLQLIDDIACGRVELVACDTREPSPFAYEILNANPYAFLDDAPLEERRARAVATRRTISAADLADLARLDPEAVAQVRSEAWPLVRNADELHDALLSLVLLPAAEGQPWRHWFDQLQRDGRALAARRSLADDGRYDEFWLAAECWPTVRTACPDLVPAAAPALPPELDVAPQPHDAVRAIVRGRMEVAGPTSAQRLAAALGLKPSAVCAALEALEGEGVVLRGRFMPDPATEVRPQATSTLQGPQGALRDAPLHGTLPDRNPQENTQPDQQWCDRRLLARIHRLTLSAARQRIRPVDARTFWSFLLRYQHAAPGSELRGQRGVHDVIAQLQGFELPGGAWERDVLPLRVPDYEPAWLDALAHSGEVAWGRLVPPRKDDADRPSGAGMSRAVRLSLFPRSNVGWLLPPERPDALAFARHDARVVYDVLVSAGALFFDDLVGHTGLLPSQVEAALSELAALGAVTCDGFRMIRGLVTPDAHRRARRLRRGDRLRRARQQAVARSGRWSKFPAVAPRMDPQQRAERWAQQLLQRYGLMCWDLLAREHVAPPWRELVAVYRRWELQGRVRGGRFVADLAGEQYALPEAVEALRAQRDAAPHDEVVVLSAADPLNLAGIITADPRVPALGTNALAVRGGTLVGVRLGDEVQLVESLPAVDGAELARRLRASAAARRRNEAAAAQAPATRHARGACGLLDGA
jgi:ATP-dependent Lhr-like helicase